MRTNNKTKILLTCFVIIAVFIATGCGGGGAGESVPAGTNSISLEWDPPSDNVDGSTLTDLAGYKIYNVTSGNYTLSATIANTTTSTTIDNLSSGNWCFVATAYNTAGSESAYSDQFCTEI